MISLLEDQPLEEYPIPLGERARLRFILYDHDRFLNSLTCCRGDFEVIGVAHTLQMRAVHQSPAGTLPTCEDAQAALAGLSHDMDRWRALVRRGALGGWVTCLCVSDDRETTERRLMHPAVYDSLEKGVRRRALNASGSDRSRLSRLRAKLADLKVSKHLIENDDTVLWIDRVLLERGERRTPALVREAAEFVSQRLADSAKRGDKTAA